MKIHIEMYNKKAGCKLIHPAFNITNKLQSKLDTVT